MKKTKKTDTPLSESDINIISETTKLSGKLELAETTRFHGTLNGDLVAHPGSTVVLGESGFIEGNVKADAIVIDGFIRGDVTATSKVVLSGLGRVIGDIKAPSVSIDYGAHFEGKCFTQNK